MKFYLAAKFGRKDEMAAYADELKTYGWEPTCDWVYGGEEGLTRREIAVKDLEDVDRCELLILFTHKRGSKQPGGGRFVEFGYALGKRKQVVIIGDYENVFTHASWVHVFPTWEAFLNNRLPVRVTT